MSEKQAKRRRYAAKIKFVRLYESWLSQEPPLWQLIRWHRWAKIRPSWKGRL